MFKVFIKHFLLTASFISLPVLANKSELATTPNALTNNAVTQITSNNKEYLISFSGLASGKDYRDVHNNTYIYDVNENKWNEGSPVPISQPIDGLIGRLASVATSINDTAYIFGGYTVAKNNSEVSVPDVYAYNVDNDQYTKLASMPVPVDDSVALTYQKKYIYLISGWHNDGNVNLVQVYNTHTNTWEQATPFPGKAVFGHAGGIVDNTIVICDGVGIDVHENMRRSYAAENACYRGLIDIKHPTKINWFKLKHPTGVSRYRMAANGFVDQLTGKQEVVFVGGSNNPYNYNGIGYNNVPSQPSDKIWRYQIKNNTWQVTTGKKATMDHRGLLKLNDKLITVGGMGKNQKVLNSINQY
jgi:N-acetylneuraminic acid mutarotase